jgi:hypothetical protein
MRNPLFYFAVIAALLARVSHLDPRLWARECQLRPGFVLSGQPEKRAFLDSGFAFAGPRNP